ncbi:MAG: hypothetical protein WD579_02375 [Candidatus Paceibacterota bacterium]
MITPELTSYIRTESERGVSEEKIRTALMNAGWKAEDIEEAFGVVRKGESEAPTPPPSSKPEVSLENQVQPMKESGAVAQNQEQKSTQQITQSSTEKSQKAAQPKSEGVNTTPDVSLAGSVEGKSNTNPDLSGGGEKKQSTSKKKFLVLTLIVAGLLLLGGGAYGYFVHFSSPTITFEGVLASMAEVETLSYDFELTTNEGVESEDNKPFLPQKSPINATGSGASDFNNGQSTLSIEFPLTGSIFAEELEENTPVVLRYLNDGNTSYLKMENVSVLGVGLFDLSPIEDSWLILEAGEGLESEELSGVDEGVETLRQTVEEMKEKYSLKDIITVTDFERVDLEGEETAHFFYTIDVQTVNMMIQEFMNEISGIEVPMNVPKSVTDKAPSVISGEEISGEGWVGTDDLLFRKIIMNVTKNTDDRVDTYLITASFSDYNEPVTVSSPSDTIAMDEFMTTFLAPMRALFGDGLGGEMEDMDVEGALTSFQKARASGSDAAIKSNLLNARAQAELYYDTNGGYEGVCNTVREEDGIKDFITKAEESSGFVECVDTATTWAASSDLLSNDAASYCVDFNGEALEGSVIVGDESVGYSCEI